MDLIITQSTRRCPTQSGHQSSSLRREGEARARLYPCSYPSRMAELPRASLRADFSPVENVVRGIFDQVQSYLMLDAIRNYYDNYMRKNIWRQWLTNILGLQIFCDQPQLLQRCPAG